MIHITAEPCRILKNNVNPDIISYTICAISCFNNKELGMVRNNIEVDVKVICIENGTTQAQIAEDINTTKSYVNSIVKKQEGVVNRTFVLMMEVLGYDIELTYVKRE